MYVKVEVVLSESDCWYENSQPKVQARNFHFKGKKKNVAKIGKWQTAWKRIRGREGGGGGEEEEGEDKEK